MESAHSEIEDVVDCLRRIDTSDLLAMQRLIEERDGLMFDGILYGPPFVDEDTPHSVFVLGSSVSFMIDNNYSNLSTTFLHH